VELDIPDTNRLVQDLRKGLRREGAYGLAAPQFHVNKQLITLRIKPHTGLPNVPELPFVAMFNPKIEVVDPTVITGWESCISVPLYFGLVPRYKSIIVRWLDQLGKTQAMQADGVIGAIIQHEVDHLHGKLFVDKITDMKSLLHLEEYFKLFPVCEAHGDYKMLTTPD